MKTFLTFILCFLAFTSCAPQSSCILQPNSKQKVASSKKTKLKFSYASLDSYMVFAKEYNDYYIDLYFKLPEPRSLNINEDNRMRILVDYTKFISIFLNSEIEIVEYDINTNDAVYCARYRLEQEDVALLKGSKNLNIEIEGESFIFSAKLTSLKPLHKFLLENYY